jgi:hypothetical protein
MADLAINDAPDEHKRAAVIEEIRAFRESLNVPPLTEELLECAINDGRA